MRERKRKRIAPSVSRPTRSILSKNFIFSSEKGEDRSETPAFAYCLLRSRRGLSLQQVDRGPKISLRSGDALTLVRWRPPRSWGVGSQNCYRSTVLVSAPFHRLLLASGAPPGSSARTVSLFSLPALFIRRRPWFRRRLLATGCCHPLLADRCGGPLVAGCWETSLLFHPRVSARRAEPGGTQCRPRGTR